LGAVVEKNMLICLCSVDKCHFLFNFLLIAMLMMFLMYGLGYGVGIMGETRVGWNDNCAFLAKKSASSFSGCSFVLLFS
jgi:thiosulfate reductase cytochrome b subunit